MPVPNSTYETLYSNAHQLYPNEMKVYYETDDFVCYYIHQNVECLYNLAIDYGYNNPKEQEEE